MPRPKQGEAMRIVHIVGGAILLLLGGLMSVPAAAQSQAQAPAIQPDRDAGTWKTWVIPSGKEFRVPPPARSATAQESAEVARPSAAPDQAAIDNNAAWAPAAHA